MTLVRIFTLWLISMPKVVSANSAINMRQGVTDISENVYQLHMTIFIVCCVIAVLVFTVMFWSIIKHRHSKGAIPAQFHESTKVEILWTAIPILILVGMAIPATSTLIAMEDPSKSELTIKVTGSQWKWHYQYLTYDQQDLDVGFYSSISTPPTQINNQEKKTDTYLLEVDNPLVLPTGKKVRFLFTSDDVIHAWWIPDFAVKKDAVPGFINEAWTNVNETGIYRGQCAELCGKNHGYMPIVVDVRTPEAFEQWLVEQDKIKAQKAQDELASQEQTFTLDEMMRLGKDIYTANCAVCHQPNGQGLPGVFPALKGSDIAIGDVAEHIDIVRNGKAGTAMQGYAKQLSSKQLAAVVSYERNAWGNNTGDVIQPKQISIPIEPRVDNGSAEAVPIEQKVEANNKRVETKPQMALPVGKAAQMKQGEAAYLANCAMCHQANGEGLPGAFPALKGSPLIEGDVAAHINIVLTGKAMTAMQGYQDKLSPEVIAAIVTYERSAWGGTGSIVQVDDVLKQMKGAE